MSLTSDVRSLAGATPAEIRRRIRSGEWCAPTAGLAPGYAQANLVVLQRESAYDFLVFCQRNPKPCPLIDVTDPGSAEPVLAAPAADLRTDLPKYRVYRRGVLEAEETDIVRHWRPDSVGFLLGCSFTFEGAMQHAGLPLHHLDEGRNVAMYITSIPCRPAGRFHGPVVVSMRPLPADAVSRAVLVTGRYTRAHGAPLHVGDPVKIGIRDLAQPDFGDAPTLAPGEVPVFWACGVTPQAVAQAAKVDFMITHAPGHMFVADLLDEDLAAG